MNESTIFSYSCGLNTTFPDVSEGTTQFLTSVNGLAPVNYRLVPEYGKFKQTLDSLVLHMNYTLNTENGLYDLYIFTKAAIYIVQNGEAYSIYDFEELEVNDYPVRSVSWSGNLYFSRKGTPLKKISGLSVTEVPVTSNEITVALASRYLIENRDHLVAANITENSSSFLSKLRWSDLYNPENWEISNDREADEFELGVSDAEISGLLSHRNSLLIFTHNSVWVGTYEGLPRIYTFDILTRGVGNSYHYAACSVRDVAYFMHKTGVYKVDSFQIVDISQEIKNLISEFVQGSSEVHAAVDESRSLIYWNVLGDDGKPVRSLIYNYVESRWLMSVDNVPATFCHLPTYVQSARVIDNWTESFDSVSDLIDNALGTTGLRTSALFSHGANLFEPAAMEGVLGSQDFYSRQLRATSVFMFYELLWREKEVDEIKLLHSAEGKPNFQLTIRSKSSVNGTESTTTSGMIYEQKLANESRFETRKNSVGKMVSFSLTCTQSATNYVKALIGLSPKFKHGIAVK